MATRWPEQGGVMPIDVGGTIKQHNRPAESSKDVSKWFTTEELTIDFGDDEGRPSEYFTMKRDYLIKFIENGWKPYNVESVSSNGDWTRDITTKTDTTDNKTSSSSSTTGTSTSSSSSTSNGTTNETGERHEDGDAYWWVKQRIKLVRRRMQPENVLGDIIKTYVSQYNAGISNEDARFNEVVQLYSVMLNHTETEANAIYDAAKSVDVQGIYDFYKNSLYYSWQDARSSAIDLDRAVNEGAEIETRIKFENLVSRTRSQMIGQGTYNGTVWPTVEAGILRQMREAIAAIRAEGADKAFAAYNNVLKSRGDVLAQLVNAQNAIIKANDERGFTVIELRNTVLKGLLDLIGKREDVYPQLQDIAQTASQLGFSVGASGNAV